MTTTRNYGDIIRKELANDPALENGLELVSFYADIAKKFI